MWRSTCSLTSLTAVPRAETAAGDIEASSGLSKEEIEKMKAEAEANAEADKKEREKVDKLNQADSMIFTCLLYTSTANG